MAGKRCFTKDVLGSGDFVSLPPRAQLLYIQMNMDADDDGVVANVRPAMANSGAGQKELEALIAARFVLKAGRVHVIKHWHLHNTVRRDRYRPSTWQADLNTLFIREDGVYTDHPGEGFKAFIAAPGGCQSGNQVATK